MSEHGSDICECGDFRSQHNDACSICDCREFKFFSRASDDSAGVWEKCHAVSTNVIAMPPLTFTAKLFDTGYFKVAGTLDGFIDLATPEGTYQLPLAQAESLADALVKSVADVKANCLYDRDELLVKETR